MVLNQRFNTFSCWTLFFCLLLGQGIDGQQSTSSTPLVYSYTRGFIQIWRDTGSNAASDVSIWKPTSDQGFFALGDYIQSDYKYPSNNVMMVMDKNDGLVVPPDSFTEVWNDEYSQAKQNVTIYKMNARAGYTCIGHVSVGAYNIQPDKNAYRCVKNDLLGAATQSSVWNTQRSKTKFQNSLWKVIPDPIVPGGIETGMFLVGSGVGSPSSEKPYVLLSSKVIASELTSTNNPSDVALYLYQTSDVDQIWKDVGSTAKTSTSIWRVKECCSLGDMAAPNYNQMVGFVAVEMIEKTLAKPTGFNLAWSNKGGKGNKIAIWNPTCPLGYVAIGQMATASYDSPSVETSTIRCVNTTIVNKGKWTAIWNDAGTGSRMNGAIWMAEASSADSKGVSAMTAVNWYNTVPGDAYVLKSANVSIRTGKLIDKVEVRDLVYDFNKKKVLAKEPIPLTAVQFANNCAGNVGDPDFSVTRTLSFKKKTETTWKFELKVAVGLSVQFTAGLPVVGQSTITTSLNVTTTVGTDRKKTEETDDSVAVVLNVPSKSKMGAYVMGSIQKVEVPWTATTITTYKDGSQNFDTIGGIFSNSQVSEFSAVKLPAQPCEPGDAARNV